MNGWDILLVVALVCVLGLSVRRILRTRGTCGCGCESCAHRGACHGAKR